jgi:hypothetical protein
MFSSISVCQLVESEREILGIAAQSDESLDSDLLSFLSMSLHLFYYVSLPVDEPNGPLVAFNDG